MSLEFANFPGNYFLISSFTNPYSITILLSSILVTFRVYLPVCTIMTYNRLFFKKKSLLFGIQVNSLKSEELM